MRRDIVLGIIKTLVLLVLGCLPIWLFWSWVITDPDLTSVLCFGTGMVWGVAVFAISMEREWLPL